MPKKIKLNLEDLNVTSFKTTEKIDTNLKGGVSGWDPRCFDFTKDAHPFCETNTLTV